MRHKITVLRLQASKLYSNRVVIDNTQTPTARIKESHDVRMSSQAISNTRMSQIRKTLPASYQVKMCSLTEGLIYKASAQSRIIQRRLSLTSSTSKSTRF